MTDRINALTVVLTQDTRDDDAQPLIDAILQLKGVHSVTTNVSSIADHVAYDRARAKMRGHVKALLRSLG